MAARHLAPEGRFVVVKTWNFEGRWERWASDFFLGVHFGGFRDKMQHVLLLDMAIHTFDAARFIIGQDAKDVYWFAI